MRKNLPGDSQGFPSRSSPQVELSKRWLVVRLPTDCRALSWAIVGGGFTTSRTVAWWQVSGHDLMPQIDPVELMQSQLAAKGLTGSVAMMTSRRIDRFVQHEKTSDGVKVLAVATVGLSNGVAAGDPATYRDPSLPGTVNILAHVSVPLSDSAMIEAVALVAEARTAALLEDPMASRLSGLSITGTGTDCVVVTCPDAEPRMPYAGKHGVVGSSIGAAVRQAVAEGRRQWQKDCENDALSPDKEIRC